MFSKFSQFARFSVERTDIEKKIITETLQSRIQNQSQSAWGITMIVEDPCKPKAKEKTPQENPEKTQKKPKNQGKSKSTYIQG